MVDGPPAAPGLALPRDTFARLTPIPFLHAHLSKADVRPSGRRLEEYRAPAINKGSLTHANGSAVVRLGDTAVVCGVRAETLLAADIPHPPQESINDRDTDADDLIESLGLLVPNVELSTGCSPAYLPGNPPGPLAQSLTYRLHSILQGILHPQDLEIRHEQPDPDDVDDELLSEAGHKSVTKAYWTLYIDVLCIALDGNALDAICLATVAALQDTVLARAWWDADREAILCSPLAAEGRRLRLRRMPIASSFAVFSTASPLKNQEDGRSWVLVDPDGFEEECCRETITVVLELVLDTVVGGRKRIEVCGGSSVTKEAMRECIGVAQKRAAQFGEILQKV